MLFIPRFPLDTFNDLSIFDVFNLAAVIVPSLNLEAPSNPVVAEVEVSTLSFVTAPVSRRAALMALEPIRAAGIVPLVNFAALWSGISVSARVPVPVTIPFVFTVTFA